MVMLLDRGIPGIWCEKADRVIAPIVIKVLSAFHTVAFHLIKLKNRHQLNRIDAQITQIRNFLAKSLIRSRCRNT